jgi:hypothetical protein
MEQRAFEQRVLEQGVVEPCALEQRVLEPCVLEQCDVSRDSDVASGDSGLWSVMNLTGDGERCRRPKWALSILRPTFSCVMAPSCVMVPRCVTVPICETKLARAD